MQFDLTFTISVVPFISNESIKENFHSNQYVVLLIWSDAARTSNLDMTTSLWVFCTAGRPQLIPKRGIETYRMFMKVRHQVIRVSPTKYLPFSSSHQSPPFPLSLTSFAANIPRGAFTCTKCCLLEYYSCPTLRKWSKQLTQAQSKHSQIFTSHPFWPDNVQSGHCLSD